MKIEQIIQACEDYSKQHFREDDINNRAARLAFEVGMLRSKMRELAAIIDLDTKLINELKQDLEQK